MPGIYTLTDDGLVPAVGAAGTNGASTAAEVAFTPTGTIAATDVQAAISELAAEASSGGGGGDSSARSIYRASIDAIAMSPAAGWGVIGESSVGLAMYHQRYARYSLAGNPASAGSVGDYLEFSAYFDAGTWEFDSIVVSDFNRGILETQIETAPGSGSFVTVGSSFDAYSTGGQANANNSYKVSGTITTPGVYKFRHVVVGKRAASSYYSSLLQEIIVTRAA